MRSVIHHTQTRGKPKPQPYFNFRNHHSLTLSNKKNQIKNNLYPQNAFNSAAPARKLQETLFRRSSSNRSFHTFPSNRAASIFHHHSNFKPPKTTFIHSHRSHSFSKSLNSFSQHNSFPKSLNSFRRNLNSFFRNDFFSESSRRWCSSQTFSEYQSRLTPKMLERLEVFKQKKKELVEITENPPEGMSLGNTFKELAEVNQVVDQLSEFENAKKDLDELLKLVKTEDDPEMLSLLYHDHLNIHKILDEATDALINNLLPQNETLKKNCIFELRPGAGGDEAGLFAVEMLKMYEKYALLKGWQWDVISLSSGVVGALKEAVVRVVGDDSYECLRYESGVHRVQRIPVTESGGRVHTSTMSIATLPEAEEFDFQLNEKDLRIDTFRAQGAGGQSVNKTDSAVRVVHIPTGIMVSIQDERAQHQNKARAMSILRSKLYEMERKKLEKERNQNRAGQIGTGERNERIRTYNFPQDRITDHRIGLTLHNLDLMMEGELLDDFISALREKERLEQIKNLENL